jgi:hypothetical protein
MKECVPTYRIEQDETICSDQVDTTTTGFTTQQKDGFFAFWIVEPVDKLLSLVDVHCTIQPKAPVPERAESALIVIRGV